MAVVSSHARYSTATDASSFTSNNLNALGSTGRPVVVIQWANGTNRRLNSVTVGGTAIKILCGAGSSPNNAGWAIAVGADAVSGEVVASFSGNVSNIVITMLRCTALPDEPFFDLNRASAFSTNVVQNVPPEGGLVLGLAHANNATAQTFAFTGMTGRYGLSGSGLQLDTTDSYGLAWDEVDGTSSTITSQVAPSGSPTYRHYVVITLRNPVLGGRPSTLGKGFWKSETSSASYTTDNLASMSGGRPRVVIWSRAAGGHSVTAVTIGGKAMAFVGSGTTQNHVTIAVGDEGDTGEIAVTYSSAPARVYIQMTRIQGQVGKLPIGGSLILGTTDNAAHSVPVLNGGCFVLSTEYNANELSNGPYVTTSPSTLVERNLYSNNTNSFSIVEGYLTSASSPLSVTTDVNFTLGQRASAAYRGLADGTRWDRINGIGSTLVVNDDDLAISGNDATFSYEMARSVHEIVNENTYWEIDLITTSGGNTMVLGVCNELNNGNGWNGSDANSGGYAVDDGNMYTNGGGLGSSGIGTGTAGDRYGFHFVKSTRQLRVRRNNGAWSSFFTVVASGAHYYISAGVGYLLDNIRLKPATRDWTDAKPAGSYAIGEAARLDFPLLTNTQTFYAATLSQSAGGQTLGVPLFTNANSFYAATLQPTITISPPLFTNTQTFYASALRPQQILQPGLFTNANAFFSPTLRASITLAPPLLTNVQTFYGPTLVPGQVTLGVPLLTNTQTFFASQLVQGGGAQTLSVPLLTNTQTFYGATLVRGAVTLGVPLVPSANSFFAATLVPGSRALGVPLIPATSQLFAPALVPGAITLQPPLLASVNAFFSPTLRPGQVVLGMPRIESSNVFLGGVLVGGEQAPKIGRRVSLVGAQEMPAPLLGDSVRAPLIGSMTRTPMEGDL